LRKRVALASAFVANPDLLVLDEPTNDLDINTLEVLEDSIKEFLGTVILVTHDRYLIDRACSVVIGFLEEGIVELFADHYQWLATRRSKKVVETPIKKVVDKGARAPSKKLTYKDERD
jgi:ATP-binding cassette subfamily F protein uup